MARKKGYAPVFLIPALRPTLHQLNLLIYRISFESSTLFILFNAFLFHENSEECLVITSTDLNNISTLTLAI